MSDSVAMTAMPKMMLTTLVFVDGGNPCTVPNQHSFLTLIDKKSKNRNGKDDGDIYLWKKSEGDCRSVRLKVEKFDSSAGKTDYARLRIIVGPSGAPGCRGKYVFKRIVDTVNDFPLGIYGQIGSGANSPPDPQLGLVIVVASDGFLPSPGTMELPELNEG